MPEDRQPYEVTPELLARYNQPGPRYTSYPTAPQFGPEFGAARYAEQLTEANRNPEAPLSLYVHIPFCRKRCHYCGCHVVITKREDVVRSYLDYLTQEIEMVAAALPDRRDVLQLHWGGGTPTHLSIEEMRELHTTLTRHFRILDGAEVAAEIDPRVTTPAHLDLLRELGFNRLSLGVQDLTPEVQEAVGRGQTLEQTRDRIEHARAIGFRDFNIDLIYGLPRQTEQNFRHTLDQVIALRPNRVAVYSYAHVPWVHAQQKRIDEQELPPTETKFALLASAMTTFGGAGYSQIGMDHFALPSDELSLAQAEGKLARNFMGYTVRAAPDMLAFGISGIGEVAGAFAQNAKKLTAYYDALDHGRFPVERGYVLDQDDRVRRFVIQSLMCNFRLSLVELRERFDVEYESYFKEQDRKLRETIEPEFYVRTDDELLVTPAGRLFVRNLCMIFDRYLTDSEGGTPLYSRTV